MLMFKRYVMNDGHHTIDFFVHSHKTRNGFCHEAAMFGIPTERDGKQIDFEEALRHRYVKVPYSNRAWESYDGQTALTRLWDKLSELKDFWPFFDGENPFSGEEPVHENLYEPDDLFGRFGGR